MNLSAETFRNMIVKATGDNLSSFVAYGSYASGDRAKNSDINTLLILNDISTKELKKISGPVTKWTAAGNPPPLIFTEKTISESADIFPMEFMDIKENSIVLTGKDIFKKIRVSSANLRLETEREIHGVMIRLRNAYMLSGGVKMRVISLMKNSISAYTAVLKSLIRLSGRKPPALKKEIIELAPPETDADKIFLLEILALKNGIVSAIFKDYERSFERYIQEWDKIRHYAQRMKVKKGK